MHNATDCIATLRDAFFVADSAQLTDAEKGTLIHSILTALPEAFNRPWVDAARTALERLYEPYRPAEARPSAGEQDAAPVDSGSGETAPEAPEGKAEGLPEQAENNGDLASSGNDDGTPAEAAAPTQEPEQSAPQEQRAQPTVSRGAKRTRP